MSKLLDAFETREDLLAGKGVAEEAIIAAEKALDLSFASEYNHRANQRWL